MDVLDKQSHYQFKSQTKFFIIEETVSVEPIIEMSQKSQKKVVHNIRTEVDSFGRKKYRLEQVALSRSESEQEENLVVDTGRHKSMLVGREEALNIDKYIGKIDTNKKKKVTEVFFCDICNEGFKCDLAYITHLNSPSHNRKIGMSMKVKNVSLQSVSSKISSLINKKQRKQKQNDLEQDLLNKLNGKNNNRNEKKMGQNQEERNQSQDQAENDDENPVKQQVQGEKVKNQENVDQESQQQDKYDADAGALAEMQMMRQLGLPTAFGSKKQKR